MKNLCTKALAITLCMLFCVAGYAQKKVKDSNKLTGTWSYSLPDAPYGYQEGTIEFKEKDGKLTAVSKISGSSYEINTIKKEGDTYHCTLYVDGSDVVVRFKPEEKNLMKGTVTADGWEMPVTFKPVK